MEDLIKNVQDFISPYKKWSSINLRSAVCQALESYNKFDDGIKATMSVISSKFPNVVSMHMTDLDKYVNPAPSFPVHPKTLSSSNKKHLGALMFIFCGVVVSALA